MRTRIFGICIVDVISRDKVYPKFLAHRNERDIYRSLFRDSMILQFKEKVSFAKYILISESRPLSFVNITAHYRSRYLACKACRKRDNSFMEFPQCIKIDPWFVIVSVNKSAAYYLHQIRIPCIIFRQKNKMPVPVIILARCLIKTRARCNIYFTADYRLDACCLCGSVKLNDPIHHTMIRDRGRVHTKFLDPADIIFYFI